MKGTGAGRGLLARAPSSITPSCAFLPSTSSAFSSMMSCRDKRSPQVAFPRMERTASGLLDVVAQPQPRILLNDVLQGRAQP